MRKLYAKAKKSAKNDSRFSLSGSPQSVGKVSFFLHPSVTLRFTAYFTVGLLIFLVYLVTMSTTLIRLTDPVYVQQFVYTVDSKFDLFKHVSIILFCFVTGGLLFSIFLVYPLVYIINAIKNLSQGNFTALNTKVFNKNGNVKFPYFLYKEVIVNILSVSNALDRAEKDREQLDESKTQWIAGVSHDIKTPLSYITGYSSLIMNKEHNWEICQITPYIEEIYGKGMYIEGLIEDLNMTFFMDTIDQSGLKLKEIDLVAFLQNIMVDIANEPSAQNYEFGFECEFNKLEAVIDERLMYRAIFNLLMNAVEHNPKETEIILSLSIQDKEIHINITDNGIGMDESMLKNVFDRYYSRNKDSKLHKGLGLCIVKQIVEAHGALISVDSGLGKGTSFHMVLGGYK